MLRCARGRGAPVGIAKGCALAPVTGQRSRSGPEDRQQRNLRPRRRACFNPAGENTLAFTMSKRLLRFAALLVFGAFIIWATRELATRTTLSSVRAEALKQNIPSGFLGVEWLASSSEVRAKRPAAVEEQQGMLSEAISFYGRPAKVTYYFERGNLVLFIFTFVDQSSLATYTTTRNRLVSEYGAFPNAVRGSDEFGPKLCATRDVKRFAIDHCLREVNGVSQEQIYFARTPG